MFQIFRLLYFFVFVFSNIILCLDAYVIYTENKFKESAELIAKLHNETIPEQLSLDPLYTEIIYKEDFNQEIFIDYLNTNNAFYNNIDRKYLLIIGDESVISPITPIQCSNYEVGYTDDLFNIEFIIGRFLVKNNQEALNQIYKIENYILNSDFGMWKNKVLLIADDENNPDRPDLEQEFKHSTYTDEIYTNYLKDKVITTTLYGTHYSDEQSLFTDIIINTINSGMSLINYIGHGTLNNLAHEDILVLDRDINLINTNDRPPIWVVGTCSFAGYKDNGNEVSFTEELLKKPDAAIAIIATTAGVTPTVSFSYLNKFYEELNSYLETSETYALRIGDIFKNAKGSVPDAEEVHNGYDCMEYTYQLFGDPALPIIIPTHSTQENEIFDIPTHITIGEKNSLNINYEGDSYIKIIAEDITYNTTIDGTEFANYNSPGGTLFESYFSDQIDYYLPFDTDANSAQIFVYNRQINNRSNYQDAAQFSGPIILQTSTNDIDEELLEDTDGPLIKLYNNNIEIIDNTSIYPPYNFRIDIADKLPINLSGIHNHNLLFWINDEKNNAVILNNMFNASSDTSGSVMLHFEDSKFEETTYYLNIESWDILSNNTVKTIRVDVNQSLNEIFNVYNFPNPFNEKTFFTFHMKDPKPIDITITIYSKSGRKIITLEESINEIKSYHVFPESGWNGTNRYNGKLKNGTYLYHLNIKTMDGEILHDKVHKATILK